MQFILWRHAEAEIGTGNDLVRTLTAKGHQQAKRTAHRINKMLPKSAKICVSEAARSQQTAAYLQRETVLLPELNPDALAVDLLPILQAYQNDECVVWVGHQFWIGQLAVYLLTGQWTDIWFKKSAFWQFDLRFNQFNHQAKLQKVFSK